MSKITSIIDLADELSEQLRLDWYAVLDAIRVHRRLFGRYEDITAAQYAALYPAVYRTVTGGNEYPWEWAAQDELDVHREAQREGDGENK